MGQVINGLFGGGGYEAPEVAPTPSTEKMEAESASTRDAERRKRAARAGGIRSTLLGTQLGMNNSGNSNMGILGRSSG